jgi:hypothetical protein
MAANKEGALSHIENEEWMCVLNNWHAEWVGTFIMGKKREGAQFE